MNKHELTPPSLPESLKPGIEMNVPTSAAILIEIINFWNPPAFHVEETKSPNRKSLLRKNTRKKPVDKSAKPKQKPLKKNIRNIYEAINKA